MDFVQTTIAGGLRLGLEEDGEPVAFAEALRLLREDRSFAARLGGALADAPFLAFRWETPPVTAATAERPFEFVLLDSPDLEGPADPGAFSEQFTRDPGADVVVFPNLGRDALLVVPCPRGAPEIYGHLAAFVRHAPELQRIALWKAVGGAMDRRIGARPVWLSTAGGGVPWLHVRLDDRPKYYGYAPYRHAG